MIDYIIGDFFNSPAQVLVNTVNTVGIMGKGIAQEFKKRYPQMFISYRNACENNSLDIGKLMLWYGNDHWILLFPTKKHWRNPSTLEYIEDGLKKFKLCWALKGIESIAFPKLGCGNGGLSWDDVRPLMEKYLKFLPIKVYIYLNTVTINPEHIQEEDTYTWIRSKPIEMSFTAIKDDIIHRTAIIPYSIISDNKSIDIKWESQNIYINDIQITEENFFQLWDYIRNNGVINSENPPIEYKEWCKPILEMLSQLGYLSRIQIAKQNLKEFDSGYQINTTYNITNGLKGLS